MSSDDNWVLGITLGLLGSIAINTGNNIQSLGLKALQSQEKVEPEPAAVVRKRTSSLPSLPWQSPMGKNRGPILKSNSLPWLSPVRAKTHSENEENEFVVVKVGRKSPFQSVTWVVGTVIFVSGSLLNFASFAFAAQSMLASLESVQFVTNLLFGRFLLGAHVTQTMLAGTCLTVTGTVMAVQFSSKETLELNSQEMIVLYQNPAYLSYLILMIILLVVLHVLYRKLDRRKMVNEAAEDSEAALRREKMEYIWGYADRNSHIILPIMYSVSAALIGTQSVVQAKILAELLAVQTSGEENAFKSWFLYMTLLLWLLTASVWLKRLNDALKMFNPLFIIPLLQCSFIFFTIVSGGIFFKEFNTFHPRQWLGFWFGIFVMFAGLVLLTPKPKNSKDDELHRALVNLLLESRASVSNVSVEHTPRSTQPTPCHNSDQKYNDAVKGIRSDDECKAEVKRTPRLSKENMTTTIDAVKDVFRLDAVTDVFTGDPSAMTLSEAMLQNTAKESEKQQRRQSLQKLLSCLKDNPISSNGYSDEILNLIQKLNLTPAPGPDIRDIAHHQARLESQIILEIEQKLSPDMKVVETPLVARDLKDRFEGSTSGTSASALSNPSPKS